MAERRDIESFYRSHAPAVYAYLVTLCRDRSWAEDLMHDTFVKATRAMGGYRGGSPKAWLFSIARSVFLDDVRRRRPVLGADPDADWPDTRVESDPAEVDAIERTLARLPERQRTALVLADRIGLSGAELAQAMGISEAAGRVLVHRARQAFRNMYEQDDE